MDFIDLVESSPEPYDNRNPTFKMDGSRTVKGERSRSRMGSWRMSNSHNSLIAPGEFGFARSRSFIDDYTDSIANVPVALETRQFFNRSTNERSLYEKRLSEGSGRDREIFDREKRLVEDRNERIDTGGYFSLGLKQQLLQRNARSTVNNDGSQQPDVNQSHEYSRKRQSLPIVYGNKKRFFEDPIPIGTGGISSLQANESNLTSLFPPKQTRFSFVSAMSNARLNPLSDLYETESMPTVSPLEKETKFLVFEMRQESNFINSLDSPITENLSHSKRLLNGEINKLEESYNLEWLELEKQIKICRYVIVPNYKYPKVNFVGRLIGVGGLTLQKICKKYKCSLSIQGAHSTKDRAQEIELLNSGDPRYAHFAGPLHIRIDVYALPHIAHMRIASVLNLLYKVFIQGSDFDLQGFLEDVDLQQNNKESKETQITDKIRQEAEAANLQAEFGEINNYVKHRDGNFSNKHHKNMIDDKSVTADNIPTQSSDILGGNKIGGEMFHGKEWNINERFDTNRSEMRKDTKIRHENSNNKNTIVYNIDDDDDDSVFQ